MKKILSMFIALLLVIGLLPQQQTLASTFYSDYQPNQYWSEDMLWAIDKGLIGGYLKVPHPTNKSIKTVGNWLDPNAPLTESQMLLVLFRYTSKGEISGSNQYQLATKYKIPVKGAKTTAVTRGNLAQALATKHFGQQVTMKEAVQFMYDVKLSTGTVDKNGKSPMTYDSYGVNDPLKRAHIVSFMKRYDTFLNSGGQVAAPKPPTEVKPPVNGGEVVSGIKVKYGKHTYGSNTQAEYDQVMKMVSEAIKEREKVSSWTVEQAVYQMK